MKKHISILGSTGSIGVNALKIAEFLSKDIKVKYLTANKNFKLLIEQTNKYKPKSICLVDKKYYKNLKLGVNTKQVEIKKASSKKEDTEVKEEKPSIVLNDQNAIPFFFEYQKENSEDKVRISTRFGDIDIQLYQNTPYHRANFIFLTN